MIDRLTYWNEEYDCWTYKGASGDAAKRLAAYEDRGLTPEEIKQVQDALNPIPFGRFHEIVEAEREGRLVILPCKEGDKVTAEVIRPYNGHKLTIHGEIVDIETVVRVKHSGCRYVDFMVDDFGKTVTVNKG